MPTPQFTINLVEGSVSLNFSREAALALQAEITQLTQALKASAVKATPGGKATPQKPMEYRHTGEVFLEIFCNPNIWASPYAAKVLVTLRDERIRLTTEAELSRLIEDIQTYLDQV